MSDAVDPSYIVRWALERKRLQDELLAEIERDVIGCADALRQLIASLRAELNGSMTETVECILQCLDKEVDSLQELASTIRPGTEKA